MRFVHLPHVHLPDLHLPYLHLPHLHLPHVHLPHLHLAHHPHHAARPAVVHGHDAEVDDLERRTLMSAVPLGHPLLDAAHPESGPSAAHAAAAHAAAAHAVVAHAVVPHVVVAQARVVHMRAGRSPAAHTTAVHATPAKPAVAPPAKVATGPVAAPDPRPTDPSLAYRSFAADPLFGPAGPTIADVNQGELGDCYLLAVLSAAAKTDPALVRQLITANANGTFTVTFAGRRSTPVTVDAALPTLPWGQPAYAQLGTGNSLWVALVEKAYAEVTSKADAYAAIAGGWMGDAFATLGLRSTSAFAASSPAALAAMVGADLKAGDLVTLGTTPAVPAGDPLIAGHAYEVDAVTTTKQGAVTGVTLRNPWGVNTAAAGYVTVTPAQLAAAFAGLSVAHA